MNCYVNSLKGKGHLYWTSDKANKGYSGILLKNHSIGNKTINGDFCNIIANKHKEMNVFTNKNCLEIGCGTGEFSSIIHEKFKCSNIIGLDISARAIEFANKKYKKKNIDFRIYDCLQNDLTIFKNINITICSNTLEHFRNPYIY